MNHWSLCESIYNGALGKPIEPREFYTEGYLINKTDRYA